jgi:hypothetical protein
LSEVWLLNFLRSSYNHISSDVLFSIYSLNIRLSISISGISNVWFLGRKPLWVPPRRRETPAKRARHGHPKDPPTPPRPPPPPMKAQRRSAEPRFFLWFLDVDIWVVLREVSKC